LGGSPDGQSGSLGQGGDGADFGGGGGGGYYGGGGGGDITSAGDSDAPGGGGGGGSSLVPTGGSGPTITSDGPSITISYATPHTVVVDRTDDPDLLTTPSAGACTVAANDCSLRGAITAANANAGDDTIYLLGVSGTVNLTKALPDLSSNISIEGPGADQFTVRRSTGGDYGIFTVTSGSVVSISGITVSGGKANFGGGIFNHGGTLTISASTISGNSAGIGGGISNDRGTLTITDSTISGNSAGFGAGGGITVDEGTTLTVTNSTFSGNSAALGGGIFNQNSTATITNSTFSGNSATVEGGGVFNEDATSTLRNTLLANNNAGGNCFAAGTGAITDGGGNLDDAATCGFTDSTSKSNTPAGLDPAGLANNGGPTETIALTPGSAAIDAAVSCPPPTTDQRGISRPQGSACDIGAFELDNSAPSAENDTYSTDEDTTLTVVAPGVLSNDNDADPADTLTADLVDDVDNGTLTLNQDGSFTYEPDDNYNGEDSFTYKASDDTVQSNEATVTITVNPVNDVPVATNTTTTMSEDGAPITINLASLASDVETSNNANLTYNIVSGPTQAQGTLSGTGSTRTFDSAENFNGSVEISYTLTDRGDPDDCGTPDDDCDAPQTSDQGKVTINVTSVNDAPTVAVSGGSCLSDTKASGTLNFTVADVDRPPLNSLVLSATSSGTTLIPNGNLVPGGNGTNSANRTLTLNAAARNSGTATITVTVSDGTAKTELPVTLRVGTQSSETITGGAGTDVIFGLGGSGILEGAGGADLMCGGNGNDTLGGGDGNDVLDGGRGDDRLNGGIGEDRLFGKAGADTLTGGTGADFFSGGSGTDTATDFNTSQGDNNDSTIP
jgi:VCBS repeat-containing protein